MRCKYLFRERTLKYHQIGSDFRSLVRANVESKSESRTFRIVGIESMSRRTESKSKGNESKSKGIESKSTFFFLSFLFFVFLYIDFR